MNNLKTISWLILSTFALGCGQGFGTKGTDTIKLFTHLSSEKTGVHFVNQLLESPERQVFNFNPIYDGAGVSTGDVNNDGLPDIYFTGNEVPNKLYLNNGNFNFEDITFQSGVAGGGGWHHWVAMVESNNRIRPRQ